MPIVPPAIAQMKSIFSGIRNFPVSERALSKPIKRSAAALIPIIMERFFDKLR